MPPPSSPVPRLSSAPSAASTVHTISSRSPITTSHHHRREGRPPRPLLVDVIATPRQQSEGQRIGLSVILPASSSSSPLFCSVCCLHRPHHLQPLTHHYVAPSPKGRAATPSASGRCHRHTSPATRRAANRAVGQPPSLVLVLASLPLFQVVMVGQRASHGGRSPPAHPVDPLHPAGGASAYWRHLGR